MRTDSVGSVITALFSRIIRCGLLLVVVVLVIKADSKSTLTGRVLNITRGSARAVPVNALWISVNEQRVHFT
jgi:hypothetical protein